MRLALALVLLLIAQPVAASDDLTSALEEQDARATELSLVLAEWSPRGVTPATVEDVEAITAASLVWLDTLDPETCALAWWAAIRTSWELTAVAVRLHRGGLDPNVIRSVFAAVGMTRQVAAEQAEGAC